MDLMDFCEDHPIMGTIVLLLISGIITAVICSVILGLFYNTTSGVYEYIDLSDDKGYAENCFVNHGYSTCYLKDGTVVKVKQFRQID